MITPIKNLQSPNVRQSLIQHSKIKQIELQNRSQKSKTSTRKLVEKPEQTIQILSDQQQEQIISEKFQEEVFKAKIQEAKLTKSKHTILKVLYVELNFRNKKENEKENRFNSMVRMYISKNLKTNRGEPFDMRSSYFFNQMVAKPGESFIENEYLLYGCDLLPHKHIEKMFQFYSPSIKWIDASHCRLTFMTKMQGWDAVINNCLQFQYLKRYILANEKVEQLMDKLELQGDKQMEEHHETKYTEEYFKLQKFKKEYHVLKEYIELMPYYELEFKRRIFIRNVTSSEQLIGYDLSVENKSDNELGEIKLNNNEKKKPESDYKRYLRVKDALWKEIQNSPLVKPQYEKIEKEIQRQQEFLRYAKRAIPNYQNKSQSRPYHNYNNNREQNFTKRGNHNNFYQIRSYNYNQDYSQKNSYNHQEYQLRNRSRDQHFLERHYPREKQSYQGKNFNGKHNKFAYRSDQLEKAFDNYIGQRDEVMIIQNPHRYLQAEFVDKRTGLHFYRNPFYNPSIQAQLSYPAYDYQDAPDAYQTTPTPTPAYDYGSQSIQNQNLSGYEYDGNTNSSQNFASVPYNSILVNTQMNPVKTSFRQRANSRNSMKSNKINQSAEQMFNKYCAQRDNNSIPQQKGSISNKQNQKLHQQISNYGQLGQSQSDPNEPFFDPQQFSIITEQKPRNPKGNKGKVIDQNLENILDQLHEDEHPANLIESSQPSDQRDTQVNKKGHVSVYQNDDDSEDLEFMLREREDFQVKCETIKQEHQSRKINNGPQGFIEEKIKEEHMPNWFKSNPVVDDSQKLSNLTVNTQNASEIQSNFEELVCSYPERTSSETVQNMKKRIHVKKVKDSSSSKSKRSGQSLTKNNRN